MFEILNMTFSKFYSPSEHVDADEVIIFLRERVVFEQHIHNKHKLLASKFTNDVTRLGTRL